MSGDRICSNCGKEIYPGASKCAYCGYPYRGDYVDGKPANIHSRCAMCGRPLPPGASQCQDCGYRVPEVKAGTRKCPRCSKIVPGYLAVCPNCGCNLRDYPRQQPSGGSGFNNPNKLTPAEIEQAMNGGMPNDTDAGTVEQINEILHDTGDDMW